MSPDRGHCDRRSEVAAACKEVGTPTAKRQKNLIAFDSRMRRRAARGYDVFVKNNFHNGLEGEGTFGKRKTLDLRWRALTDAEKDTYRQQADAENEEAEQHDDEDYPQFVNRNRGADMKQNKNCEILE
jgi:hypothetical protein